MKNAADGPQLSAPADGEVLDYPNESPVLRWVPLRGVKSYRVELDDADDFIGAQLFTTANTAVALNEPLILGKTYYWRVQGVSATSGVTGAFSDEWSFRMDWPAAPGKPVLRAPANDPAVEVSDVVFRWDPVVGAKNYQIQVSPNPEFASNIIDDRIVRGTQYSPAQTYNNASYYWRVRAQDTGSSPHQGPWSDAWVFSRAWSEKPQLLTPANGAQIASPRFTWSGIKRASHYEVQFSTDPNFSGEIQACTTFHTSFTPHRVTTPGHSTTYPPSLQSPTINRCVDLFTPGGHYYWRVRGLDLPAGINGVFSTTSDFFFMPGVPAITGPAPGTVTPAPVLSWEPLSGHSQYRVVMTRTSTGTVSTYDTYATTYTPTGSLAAGDYTWYVVGLDSAGRTGVSPAPAFHRSFTVEAPTATGSPAPTETVDGPGRRSMPSLRWRPVTGAVTYQVYTTPVGGAAASALGSPTRQTAYTHPGDVLPEGGYTWYVVARNSATVEITRSSPQSFVIDHAGLVATYRGPQTCTLADCPAPQQSTPELSWDTVPGAGFYKVWVALDANFTNVVRGYTTQFTTLTPRESYLDNGAGQSYFWFVQPCLTTGVCGEFEGAQLPTRAQAFRKASAGVVLLSPANTVATNVTDAVSFRWQDYRDTTAGSGSVKNYNLQVAIDPAFNTIVDDVTVDQPAHQAWAKSYPDGVYFWRVRGIDGGGIPLTSSPTWTFQKSSGVPVLSDATVTAGLPTFTWTPRAYSSGYIVEVYKGPDPAYPAANRVLNVTTKLPAYTPDKSLAADTYSWRVRKLNPDGHSGPWSVLDPVPTFIVDQPAPTPVQPANNAKVLTEDLLFTWAPVGGAAAYQFESSTSTSFAVVHERVTTVMTSWAPVQRYADRTTYYWRVKVLDGSSNVLATSAAIRFSTDAVAPQATVAPTTAVPVSGPITVTFDEPVTGVGNASVMLRRNGSGAGVAGTVAATTPTTATFRPAVPLVPGAPYELVVGAPITDLADNPITPAVTPLRTETTIENTSPALTQLWTVEADTTADGGRLIKSDLAGSAAAVAFTGTSIAVLGRRSNVGGYADIYLDGVKQNTTPISFYSSSPSARQTVFSKTGLPDAAHTLTVRVLGTKATASAGTWVALDAFVAGTTYQENAAAVRTAFRRVTSSAAAGGSYDVADAGGADYRFSFHGRTFAWTATTLPTGGRATVYVDGTKVADVSQYSATARYKVRVFTAPTLAAGEHSVRIVVGTGRPAGSTGTDVTFDAVTVT